MRNDPTRGRRLKQQLPYPYDQDLSKVLRGLKRRNPITRRSRQANDPVTAAYLAAAALPAAAGSIIRMAVTVTIR